MTETPRASLRVKYIVVILQRLNEYLCKDLGRKSSDRGHDGLVSSDVLLQVEPLIRKSMQERRDTGDFFVLFAKLPEMVVEELFYSLCLQFGRRIIGRNKNLEGRS